MKKLFIFSLLIWQFNCLKAQSSIYKPFPADSAVWSQTKVSYDSQNNPTYHYSCFKMLGDTTINTINYKKIYRGHYSTFNIPNYNPSNFVFSYEGALRQNASVKKIFYLPKTSNELTLFDFNLTVGDTVHNIYDYQGNNIKYNQAFIVSKVDSILIGFQFHKTFEYGPNNVGLLVEGMGSLAGLFEFDMLFLSGSNSLDCFSVKNVSLYSSSYCGIALSVDDKGYSDKIKLEAWPNPIINDIVLQIVSEGSYTISVMNTIGQMLYSSEKLTLKTVTLDFSKYDSGIYFIQLN